MRKWMMGAALVLALMLAAACGAADGEGEIVQSSCNIVQSGEYYLVYCFAQIHNNSDQIICLNEGSFELYGGEQLLASHEISQIWPYFINPGEDGYLFDIVSFEPNEDGAYYPQVSGIDYFIDYMTVDPQFASRDLSAQAEIERSESGELSIVCQITNGTDEDAYDPTVALGLYTEGGSLIYTDGLTVQHVGIPAGGTVLLRFPVDGEFVSQWDTYGAIPAEARVIASFRNDTD